MASDENGKKAGGAGGSGAPGTVSFSGTISRVVFQNAENGFAIIRVEPDAKSAGRGGVPRSEFACLGTLLGPQPGQRLRFEGRFVDNPRYGRQFQFSSANLQVPTDTEGLIAYLSSSLIKGLGPDLAGRVVKRFGQDTIRILDEEPGRLREVRGIGEKTCATITESWRAHRSLSDLMQFLQPHGITPALGVRIYRQYGALALDVVRENPYRLAMDIPGIGFITADAIAEKIGVPRDSPLRMQGGVLYALQKASENGDVYLPGEELAARVSQDLQVSRQTIFDAVTALEEERRVTVDAEELDPEENRGIRGDRAVYLAAYFTCESRTAYYLERLRVTPRTVTFPREEELVQQTLREQEHRLAEAQVEAVRMSARAKVMVLTGGPGTGKTTIIRAIISLYERRTRRIYLAAPTGRAAKRMAEATGRDARTLHRMLEFNPVTGTFARNEDEPLACDLLIVDEASMMDTILFYQLIKAVPTGCVVILVGDIHQLPSVGPGAVLADIIASGRVPVIELTEIFRQARTSDIVANAHLVNNGDLPPLVAPWEKKTDFYFLAGDDMDKAAGDIVRLISREIPRRFGFDAVRDIQLLTPMHKGAVGTASMNSLLQAALNPPKRHSWSPAEDNGVRHGDAVFRPGDRVMQIRNNYDKDVFNGDLGIIREADKARRMVTVLFDEDREVIYESSDMDELVLAYAISIHKSQGSEYPVVVIPLFLQHYIMLQRNLLYTAITRGRKLVVLVGDRRALERAVQTADVRRRCTRLARRLRSYAAGLPG